MLNMRLAKRMWVGLGVLLLIGGVGVARQANAQAVVKIGQIEAQTGPTATYGWMSSQGAKLAVKEINDAGGFQVAGKPYKLELIQMDTRGEPREATVQFKKFMEDGVKFVFGPFLSNVFNSIEPIANLHNGKFLMFAGATAAHSLLGTPNHDYLLRTFNWDSGPSGFGTLMVAQLKKQGVKRVAMLFQNDAFGKVAADIYSKLFKDAGIELRIELFEPGTKDFSASLAKMAADKPDYLFPGYSDAVLYDIVRQATETGLFKKFFIVRGSIGPALKNKDAIDDYMAYVPKYFESAEKTEKATSKFIAEYKTFYKREFPYDQAPLCASSCYDHVYMLVNAMKAAESVDDVAKIKKALMSTPYDGLWKIKYDETGEVIFKFDLVQVKRGGAISVISIDPIK
jgi:branched-chain amino acid transport system substrate-binding protein